MTVPSSPLIDTEHIAFMQGSVSINIAGCSADNMPSLTRATGCHVSADGCRITLFVAATHSAALLADLRDNGAIAVVFSRPSTHRTMQLKGSDAQVRTLRAGEFAFVEAYRDNFVAELAPFGYDASLVRTLLACAPENLLALEFTPSAAFIQTPGPQAGQPLRTSA